MFTVSPQIWIPLAAIGLVLVVASVAGRVPLRYNFRNLTVRWKTTVMTALAFTLVVALLVVMLAFVNGVTRLTKASGQPGNVMILSEDANDEAVSNLPSSAVTELELQPGIVQRNGRPMVSRETYLIVVQPIADARPGGPQRRFLQMRGVEDPLLAAEVHALQLYPGGAWFAAAGVRQLTPGEGGADQTAVEAVLGEGIAREMVRNRTAQQRTAARDPERLTVGDTFELGDRTWVVAGVMQSAGTTFDSEVWAKREIVAPLFGKDTYTTIIARTKDAEAARKLADYFSNDYTKAEVRAQTETDYFESLSETNKQLLVAVVFVTVVMSVGGIFGVMNTMFAAISQRTADIGVMRMLGFARWQVLVSFLMESLLIAMVGGVAGCLVGSLADGWTANSIAGGSFGGKLVVLQLVVDANAMAAGMLVAVLMGLFGGLLPALSAVRLRPLEALR